MKKTNFAGYLVLAAACWGFGTVMSKAVLDEVPPITLLVAQLAVSVVFLWAVVLVTRVPVVLGREGVRLGLAGLLNPGLAYTFGLLGLAITSASMSSLIWAAEPAIILGLAWLFLRERMSRRLVVVSLLAIGGALVVVGSGAINGSSGSLTGNGLILAAVLCCATYTVLTRQSVERVHPLLLVAVQQSVSLLWALIIWPFEFGSFAWESVAAVGVAGWLGAAASGLVYYAFAFWFYILGLRSTSASVAGLYLNLIPIFGLAGAYLFLGEQLGPTQWIGAVIILGAVAMITRLTGSSIKEEEMPVTAPTGGRLS